MEEATLRAKIQAMKNLLEAKRQSVGGAAPAATSYSYSLPKYGQYQSRKDAASGPVNRSWNRFSPPDAAVNQGNGSSNKVWRREDALATTLPLASMTKAWKRPMKVAANKSKSMQLQVLRLEDGEYAKAHGGFSLVRAGVKKSTPVTSAVATAKPMPVIRSNSNSVHIGGVKYVVANGGKVLKRCSTEERKANVAHRRGPMSIITKSGAARAALIRAKATMQRARSKRFQTKKAVNVRTVYCSFYNRFGYCKNKEECRFIHDSRRVAMCRKFLKNECNDPKCLLSHHHDENKVPDCKMFLRGACTREGCKYRHVKVSATAELCEPFTKGYCPKGGACPLRHELPQITRSRPSTASGTLTSPCSEATNASPASSGPASASGSPKNGNGELSIRPNIRFASKHSTGFPSLFDGLRRSAK
ncbi:hypothetical protein PC116_g9404 [Phytophthora cactorum]|uniref:C3H1-type domain-containing protein n=2 Tax=Phytophthora cactorum TaxID=29920 RepID=A0A329T0N7_9STRA|nr:hypothetical protein Pcac1_g20649 [Phytophthora cactorum]KAG2804702.1 hypothetical protein PC112_g18603 [Phytophthora cactorum]KAG2835750.1 hypothetical protein PC111_g5324 [Phytophthora cactorum]KAG2859364.1 hypothetical protein PC113_g8999 [Phytophthora cactorum]KAG2908164.1 hypothetical protein PC117_g20037 [Phytophthora cactorum]